MKLLALALAPVVFIFTYVYLRDKYEREPLKYLIISFLLGVLIAFPVVFVGEFLSSSTGISNTSGSPAELFVYAFFVVALTEELMKYLVLRYYNYPHEEFDEPYDGIMYGVAVSLGFAAIENVLYVFTSEGGLQTGLLRMFTAVPAHAVFGVIMGYFVGKAKFLGETGNPYRERMKGLAGAVLLHGLYDYFLFLGNEFLALFAFVALFMGIGLAYRAMRLHSSLSPHKDEEPPFDDDSLT
ncbi:MAG: PrsW family glutamic-type intramembrane protease [Bacteroidia bacterium]|nr:PrsW family glutamic-type intramembrane protease [Bacteroidia bacterium]